MTETHFRIELDEGSLRKSGSLVTGEVWLRAGTFEFPTALWNDIVVVILGWWTRGLLVLNEAESAEWSFMDGPWFVRLFRQSPELIELRFFDDHGDETTEPAELRRILVSRRTLAENLTRVGAQVLRRCDESGWQSTDLETLRANLGML